VTAVATVRELRLLRATLVFDLRDGFVSGRGLAGAVVRPLEPVRFLLLRREGAGGPVFDPPLDLHVLRNPSGYHLFFDAYRQPERPRGQTLRPDRSLRRVVLPDGVYRLRIESRFYQPVELTVDVPMVDPRRPRRLALQAGHAYPFPGTLPLRLEVPQTQPCSRRPRGRGPTLLRGSLHAADGSGVGGAQVDVEGTTDSYRTGASGDWVLLFPETQPSGPVTVRVRPPAGPTTRVPGVCVVQGRETSLVETALRGWVQDNRGMGIPDVTIRVAGRAATSRTGQDGGWFYYFPFNQASAVVRVTAELADGRRSAPVETRVEPRATVVVPTIRIP
jgi:hypothetical protein